VGWEAVFAVAVIVAVFFGLVRNYSSDALIIGGAVLFGLAGILTPVEVFEGFANDGMLTVAALFVVAAGLRETGALDILGRWLLGTARTERGVMVRMGLAVPAVSAVLNNTPVVAMFMPVLTTWGRKHQVAASRLLIPLSYLSILGGTCTLIGTSTNLVVNGLMLERHAADPTRMDLAPMGMFEIAWAGVPYALAGMTYLWFFGRRLLPDRKDFLEKLGETSREYLANMRVEAGCPLDGQTIAQAGLRHLKGLFLVEITRDGETITPVRPDQIMHEGDMLTFTGVVNNIVDLERIKGLVPVTDEGKGLSDLDRRSGTLCEAVVSNTSPLVGKSIRESNFRALYNAAVIAVHRGGQRMKGRLGDIVMREGDTLLLQAGPHFIQAHRNDPDFFLVSGVEDSRPVRHEKALIAIGLTVLLIFLLTTGLLGSSTALAAFTIAGLMVATRCISVAESRQSVDIKTIITIAAAFALGKGLVNAGVVGAVAGFVVQYSEYLGPIAVLAGIYMVTSFFTEIVTNNAAAALMFPFAVEIADQLDVSARPFVFAVALAASASFVTPLGYQTNLMVFGAGGYKFADFVRVGAPLNLILLSIATLIVPLIWPF